MQYHGRSQNASFASMLEPLESRQLLSAATVTTIKSTAAKPVFGEAFDLTVKVATTKGKTVDKGTVELFSNGKYTGSALEVNSKGVAVFEFAAGNAPPASTQDYYAHYVVNSGFSASTSKKADVTIEAPTYTSTASDGVGTEILTAGTGAGAVSGDAVKLKDTGYTSDGTLFTETSSPPPPFYSILTVDASPAQTIAGFNQALVGCKVGEIIDFSVPSAEAYGDGTNYYFVMQVVSIST